jgi:phytol kinase
VSDLTSAHDLWGVLLFSALFGFLFLMAELLKRKTSLEIEYTRKLVHLGGGFIAYFLPQYFQSHWPVLVLAIVSFVTLWLSRRFKKLDSIHGVMRRSSGALIYPVSLYGLFLLSQSTPLLFQIPVLVLAFSDTFGALIGQAYGRIKYEVLGQTRSLEGSITFMLVTFLTVHIPLLLSHQVSPLDSLLIALLLAVLVTAFEAISLGGSDNLFIPFGTYFVLARVLHLKSEDLVGAVLILVTLLAVGLASYRQQRLTMSGAIGAFLIGYGTWMLGGFDWFLPLLFFYLTYNLIERFSLDQPIRSPLERGQYELSQIFFVSIASLVIVVAYSYTGWSQLFAPYLASVSANSSISWMTFLKQRPLFFQSSWMRLTRWTISVTASLIPLAPFLAISSPYPLDIISVIVIVLGGLLALSIKEFLGWTVQAYYHCTVCGLTQTKPFHCSESARHTAGWRWLDIDRAHVISVSLGSALGYLGGPV